MYTNSRNQIYHSFEKQKTPVGKRRNRKTEYLKIFKKKSKNSQTQTHLTSIKIPNKRSIGNDVKVENQPR